MGMLTTASFDLLVREEECDRKKKVKEFFLPAHPQTLAGSSG